MIQYINFKKRNYIRGLSLLAAACIISVTAVKAQDGPDDPGDGGCLDCEGTTVPFDGGVSLLVAAGIGYGAKKAYDAKKMGTATGTEGV